MVCATCTTSYETDTKIASSPSSTSTPNQPNFISPSTPNPINENLTLPSILNTKSAHPPNPPTSLCHPPSTPLFCPVFTVWWGPVEAIVRHVEQTTYSTGSTSFSYQLLIPSGITITVQETCLETSTPPAPPPHSNAPTPSLPVYVPDVTSSMTLPYISPPLARPQLPAPPTHAPRLPCPIFTPHPTLPPIPLPPL